MIKRIGVLGFGLVAAWGTGDAIAQTSSADLTTNLLQIQSVEVSGRMIPLRRNGEIRLGSFPQNIIFHFKAITNAGRLPIRLRYKLEGQPPGIGDRLEEKDDILRKRPQPDFTVP